MKKILIADDEPHIVDLLKLMLRDKYQLYIATDGKETLEILKKVRPDLILLDVMMPHINGFEICEKIKSNPKTNSIKIAMLSAKTQEKDIVEGLKLGADYYLTKPFDPTRLEEYIGDMLK